MTQFMDPSNSDKGELVPSPDLPSQASNEHHLRPADKEDPLQRARSYPNALLVVAKRPAPGRTKTRLSPPLSPEQAAALYECFLKDTLGIMRAVAGVQPAIAYLPQDAAAYFAELAPDFELILQQGPDLGCRLDNALTGVIFADNDGDNWPGTDERGMADVLITLSGPAIRWCEYSEESMVRATGDAVHPVDVGHAECGQHESEMDDHIPHQLVVADVRGVHERLEQVDGGNGDDRGGDLLLE